MSLRYLESSILMWREKRYADAAFAKAPTGNINQHAIPVEKVGDFISAVFIAGTRHYMFHGTQNRDRFVNLFRNAGAQQVGKDPCP